MRTSLRHWLLLFGTLLVIGAGNAMAQVPQLINYQGRIGVGTVDFNGAGQFKFALVDTTGANTYWSNDGTSTAGSQPTNAVSLTVAQGLYAVRLGDVALPNMTAIPATVFSNADVRLRIWFNDGTNGFQLLTPDQRIVAVGYAMIAAGVPNGAITSAMIGTGAVGATKLATGSVGSAAVDSTQVQVRVSGAAPSGSFITGINADGTVSSAMIGAGAVGATNLATGSVGSAAVNSAQVQLRVSGAAPSGSFITGINSDGTVSSAAPSGGGGGVPNGFKEFTTAGASTFVVPVGITKLMVEAWGAGGGGGANTTFSAGGPGGGGAYSRSIISVTPGATYNVTVGLAGAGAANGTSSGVPGVAGGDTIFADPVGTALLRSGGGGGGPASPFTATTQGVPDPNAAIQRTYTTNIQSQGIVNRIVGSVDPPVYGTGIKAWPGMSGPGGSTQGQPGANGYLLITW